MRTIWMFLLLALVAITQARRYDEDDDEEGRDIDQREAHAFLKDSDDVVMEEDMSFINKDRPQQTPGRRRRGWGGRRRRHWGGRRRGTNYGKK